MSFLCPCLYHRYIHGILMMRAGGWLRIQMEGMAVFGALGSQ